MAFRLFLHAFQTIFGNFRQALVASLAPFLIFMLSSLLVLSINPEELSGTTLLIMLLWILLIFFASGLIAASWHRFILLEEPPEFLGTAAMKRAFPYVGTSILLGFWMLMFLTPLLMLFGPTMSWILAPNLEAMQTGRSFGFKGLIAQLVFGAVFGWLFLTYALVLPATALGGRMKFRESRKHTARLGGQILIVALLLAAFNALSSLMVTLLAGILPSVVSLLLTVAVQWLVILVGVSILTTLYGHLVEGRDLPA